jgi:hypothetical protein
MPLQDGYQAEKDLKELSDEIAKAITESFIELGINQTTGFALFLIDFSTGTLQYVSDSNKEDVNVALNAHLKRSLT